MKKLSSLLLLIYLNALPMSPTSRRPTGLSISSDSALIPSTISIEEYEVLESQLFTYQQLAAIRKKQLTRLKKKIAKDSNGSKKKKRIRIKVKKKKQSV